MADIAALKANLDAAEAAKDALVAERRANRDSMTRAEFRAYNESSRAQQKEIQAAVDAAQTALSQALNMARQQILVDAIGETETT